MLSAFVQELLVHEREVFKEVVVEFDENEHFQGDFLLILVELDVEEVHERVEVECVSEERAKCHEDTRDDEENVAEFVVANEENEIIVETLGVFLVDSKVAENTDDPEEKEGLDGTPNEHLVRVGEVVGTDFLVHFNHDQLLKKSKHVEAEGNEDSVFGEVDHLALINGLDLDSEELWNEEGEYQDED